MKTKTIQILLIALFAIFVLALQSCKKDDVKTNNPPTCVITSPANGEQIMEGATVTVSADVNDNDGNIKEVRFFIDNIGKSSASGFPFNFDWNTNNESLGEHTIKATCIDNSGNRTSDEITVTVLSSGIFNDPRDGQTYKIVNIGNQTWFAENLKFVISGSWWYENSSANGDIYGRLYNWDAAVIACPSGWHLPSDEEWKTLEMNLGMSQSEANNSGWRGTDEGGKMKESGTTHWNPPDSGATNSSGFTALPGGFSNNGGASFYDLGDYGYWWTSSKDSPIGAFSRELHYDSKQILLSGYKNDCCLSVRCLKD